MQAFFQRIDKAAHREQTQQIAEQLKEHPPSRARTPPPKNGPGRPKLKRCAEEVLASAAAAASLTQRRDHRNHCSARYGALKPRVLQWCIDSWQGLRERKELILDGWEQSCLSLFNITSEKRRRDAVELLALKQLDVDEMPAESESDGYAESDSEAESDELDLSKPRQFGKQSERVRTQAKSETWSTQLASKLTQKHTQPQQQQPQIELFVRNQPPNNILFEIISTTALIIYGRSVRAVRARTVLWKINRLKKVMRRLLNARGIV